MESLTKELCPDKAIAKETNNSDIKQQEIQTIKVNPNAVFDSESKKDEGEIDRLQDTSLIQDAFIFCPMLEPPVFNETLVQGIFASEREMSNGRYKISIFNRFITIEFSKKDGKCKPL